MLDKINLLALVPDLSIKIRHLPDSVACTIACLPSGGGMLALVDDDKPLVWQQLAQMLCETALLSVPATERLVASLTT